MATIVAGWGCPKNAAMFVSLRIISNLVIIPMYFVFTKMGFPQFSAFFLFMVIMFVAARAWKKFDPDWFIVTDNPDGGLRVHGNFKEMAIDQSSPYRLKKVSLATGGLRLTLLRDDAEVLVSVDESSFRQARLSLLNAVLEAFVRGDLEAMKNAMIAAGHGSSHGTGGLFTIKEPPGFGRLVFGSLVVSLLIFYVAYNILVINGRNA